MLHALVYFVYVYNEPQRDFNISSKSADEVSRLGAWFMCKSKTQATKISDKNVQVSNLKAALIC